MNKNKNIIVVGSNGQLGREFKRLSLNSKNKFYFFDFPDIDIRKKNTLLKVVESKNFNTIINCAAYTDVKNAEKQKKLCSEVNDYGVENLVEICEKFNLQLIHFSTDYVYSSTSISPINENELVNPLNHYGLSKRNGEIHIENSIIDAIIIRTSWLYSKFGNNFVNTILKNAEKNNQLQIVNDEYGSPTYAYDLANTTIKILDSFDKLSYKNKIYNYSNLGTTNWYNFAKEILEISKIKCKLIPVSADKFNSNVVRPKFSVMSKKRIMNDFDLKIKEWKISLNNYLKFDINESRNYI